jgi:hypothetical protein
MGETAMGPGQREKVAIVKYDGTPTSLARALELCDGLDGLKAAESGSTGPGWPPRGAPEASFGAAAG